MTTKLITKRFTCKKDTNAPKLNKLTVLNNVKLLLEFSDSNGLDKATAQDEDNYRITQSSGSLDVEAAQVKDRDDDGLWDSVELVTESQEPGKAYTLIIEGISDGSVLRNKIAREIKKEFRGKSKDRTAPSVAHNPKAVTDTMVEIEFEDANALDIQSACDMDKYDIDEDLEIKEIRIKNPNELYSSEGRTVLLITSEMEKSESYTLVIKGIIDEVSHTIKLSVPEGTDLTNMVASFSYIGKSVQIGETSQYSGATANNFSETVKYVIAAHDGSPISYTVSVNK
ncbi:MAG: SwmB domain-containing protein [Clostridia bacterium]